PHAAFAVLFCLFVRGGFGFTTRYTYDFLPMIALVGVQLALALQLGERRLARDFLAVGLVFGAVMRFHPDTIPNQHPYTMPWAKLEERDAEWIKMNGDPEPQLPSRIDCGGPVVAGWPLENGLGLMSTCEIGPFTNLYLGVPQKEGDYQLRFKVDRPMAPVLRVYFNGRTYEAHLEGSEYVVPVKLDFHRLYTPIVALTVEWTRE